MPEEKTIKLLVEIVVWFALKNSEGLKGLCFWVF